MNNVKLKKNIMTGFAGQSMIIILGVIVPRFFISCYGSDVNGLLGTISQLFSYMALMESGIGQAAKNLLFKYFENNDEKNVNEIISAASNYYRKFTAFYFIGVIILAVSFPFIINTNVSYSTVFWIVFLDGISSAISFFFTQTNYIILEIDGKSYVNNTFGAITRIIGYLFKITISVFSLNIILLQIINLIFVLIKVFFYDSYVKKHYPWIRRVKTDLKLKDRNSYVLTEIATTVFNSTDMIVLSVFLSTQFASVYSIYNMIYVNIISLLNAVYFSVVYIPGTIYHSDIKKYTIVHDSFTTIFLGAATVLMSVCYLLSVPFVSLYTSGITDINYVNEKLPLLFSIIHILSISRYVSGNLTGLSGYARQTSYISVAEAFINIALSIVLVKYFGVAGVLIATIVALPLKIVWCIYIADIKVIKRSCLKTVKILSVNYILFGIVVIISHFIKIEMKSYFAFVVSGFFITVILMVFIIGINFMINRNCFKIVKDILLKRSDRI